MGALPKNKIKSLYVQYSRAGYNQPNGEPWPLEPEPPTVLRDAIGVHLSQHNYTIPELASVVHLTTEEFVDKYDVGWCLTEEITSRRLILSPSAP